MTPENPGAESEPLDELAFLTADQLIALHLRAMRGLPSHERLGADALERRSDSTHPGCRESRNLARTSRRNHRPFDPPPIGGAKCRHPNFTRQTAPLSGRNLPPSPPNSTTPPNDPLAKRPDDPTTQSPMNFLHYGDNLQVLRERSPTNRSTTSTPTRLSTALATTTSSSRSSSPSSRFSARAKWWPTCS
jgi:hypothetical protein